MPDEPEVRVELTGDRFHPGDEVGGAFVLPGGAPADAESVELSVLWHTSGKGTEDLGVIHYQGWSAADGTLDAMPNPGTFAVRLPNTPWSYDGTLVKVHWVARVRVRYGATGEVVAEAPFVLAPRGRP
jgi:hypothetical protein